MIAGELEQTFRGGPNGAYDHFIFGKKKKKAPLTPQEIEAKKQKRKAFWEKLGQKYERAGGIEGILGTVANVTNYFKADNAGQWDYDMNMGHPEEATQQAAFPKEVWIIVGAVVLAAAIYGINRKDIHSSNSNIHRP